MAADSNTRSIYRTGLNVAVRLLGVKRAKQLDAKVRFHRTLDLDNPRTLADKVSWIELNTDRRLAARLTDKYEVRDYVAEKGLEDTLIPLCGGPWESADDIDIAELPERFVLKATHGCEMNYICKDKGTLDVERMLARARKWLASDYSRSCIEPHYKLIPHRLYAEEFIGGMDGVIDYKFHCLNGEPRFVLACSGREESVKLNLYDLNWVPMEGVQGPKKNSHQVARPSSLNRMVEVARVLSGDFDFVRVDLYEHEGAVRFGELTFTPASGVFPNFTDEFIGRWGEVLHVSGLD